MSVRLYLDHQVQSAIAEALRARRVDVLTAYEDGHSRSPDPVILERATSLGRVLFTRDEDFLAHAAAHQRAGRRFSGVIYAHQLKVPIGECVDELEYIAHAYAHEELESRVTYLPT